MATAKWVRTSEWWKHLKSEKRVYWKRVRKFFKQKLKESTTD